MYELPTEVSEEPVHEVSENSEESEKAKESKLMKLPDFMNEKMRRMEVMVDQACRSRDADIVKLCVTELGRISVLVAPFGRIGEILCKLVDSVEQKRKMDDSNFEV
jgi:hypothetical protein